MLRYASIINNDIACRVEIKLVRLKSMVNIPKELGGFPTFQLGKSHHTGMEVGWKLVYGRKVL